MTWFEALLAPLQARFAPPKDAIRREAWALGSRHQGEVVAGARAELKAPNLPIRRAVLLRAVIRTYLAAPVTP